jgi:hypothetical protein
VHSENTNVAFSREIVNVILCTQKIRMWPLAGRSSMLYCAFRNFECALWPGDRQCYTVHSENSNVAFSREIVNVILCTQKFRMWTLAGRSSMLYCALRNFECALWPGDRQCYTVHSENTNVAFSREIVNVILCTQKIRMWPLAGRSSMLYCAFRNFECALWPGDRQCYTVHSENSNVAFSREIVNVILCTQKFRMWPLAGRSSMSYCALWNFDGGL